MFVSCIIDQYHCYAQTTTCRVESHHALLKLYLESTQSNLDRLLSAVDKILFAQEREIKESFNRSKNEKFNKCDIPIFSELWYKVSKHAFNLMHVELNRDIAVEKCGHKLRTVYGLPCFCEFEFYRIHGKYIQFMPINLFFRINISNL